MAVKKCKQTNCSVAVLSEVGGGGGGDDDNEREFLQLTPPVGMGLGGVDVVVF